MNLTPPKPKNLIQATTLNFDMPVEDMRLIGEIMKRAMDYEQIHKMNADHLLVAMDISTVHCNGTPLHLMQFLMSDKSDFIADFTGIQRNIDRKTGRLLNDYVPRFAVKH